MNRYLLLPTSSRLIAAGLLAFVAASSPALSCEGEGHGPRGMRGKAGAGERAEALARRLDLSAEQKAAFDEITAETRTALEPLHQQLRERVRALRASDRDLGREDLREDPQIQSLRQQIHTIRSEQRSRLEEILTAEQVETLDQLRQTREKRRRRFQQREPGSHRGLRNREL